MGASGSCRGHCCHSCPGGCRSRSPDRVGAHTGSAAAVRRGPGTLQPDSVLLTPSWLLRGCWTPRCWVSSGRVWGWVSETGCGCPHPGMSDLPLGEAFEPRDISSPGVLWLVGAYVSTSKKRPLVPWAHGTGLEASPTGQMARVCAGWGVATPLTAQPQLWAHGAEGQVHVVASIFRASSHSHSLIISAKCYTDNCILTRVHVCPCAWDHTCVHVCTHVRAGSPPASKFSLRSPLTLS